MSSWSMLSVTRYFGVVLRIKLKMLEVVSYILEKPLYCNQALTSSGLDLMSRDGGPLIFC